MSDVDPETITDAACGILFHLLTKDLQAEGILLSSMVEGRIDFREKFHAVFSRFHTDYPELADALVQKYGGPDQVYELIRQGEGTIPSRTTTMYWIVLDAPSVQPEAIEEELAGKWLIFLPPENADEAWVKVRNATWNNELGISAKVSTARPNPDSRDTTKVIYVYTRDWRDEADVMRVRERLRELGFSDRLGYKRNIETFKGEYSQKGKRVTFYSA